MMSSNYDETDEDTGLFDDKNKLAAKSLLQASPIHFGTVLKLHVPVLYRFLPEFVQSRVSPNSYVSYLLAPQWKERELILCGSYLYRFLNLSSSSPKGAPIEVKGVDAKIVDEDDEEFDDIGFENVCALLPSGAKTIIAVNSFGKSRFFATSSREDALTWVNSIRETRQEVITREMGHSRVPVPESWKYFDALAKALIEKKERIKRKTDDAFNRQLEVGTMGGSLRPVL